MGQKSSPVGLRLQINRTWDSRWFAEGQDYGRLLLEDLKMRRYIMESLPQAAISKVVMAGVRADHPRLAIGSVGPTVVRLTQVEDALAAGRSIDEAVALLEQDIRPIDDLRSSATYRANVTGNLLRRFWEDTAP